MVTQVTAGIQITVRTKYQESYSKPSDNHFLFTYIITIENKSEFTVQLMRRHWFIFDSNGEQREVEGEGVVGQQPVLMPGDVYEYESACNLMTDMGAMHGTYLFERKADRARFVVQIPEFRLEAPMKMN